MGLVAGLDAPVALVPEAAAFRGSIAPGVVVRLRLTGLRVGREYEVLVSWPASHPVTFVVTLERFSFGQRELLNTEKLVFVATAPEALALLVAASDAVLAPGVEADPRIPFAARLLERRWGVPVASWPVVASCVVLVLLIGLVSCWAPL